MRFSYNVILLCICFFASQSFAANCEEQRSEILKVGCQMHEIAQKIHNGKSIVPKYIYHFGPRKFLAEDIQLRTLPQKAWDESIMKKDGYGLTRRGLYGSTTIDSNRYGDASENGWIIEIEIADACRQPDAVLSFAGLPGNKTFQNWFAVQKGFAFKSIKDFVNRCYDVESTDESILVPLHFEDNSDCESVGQKYSQEKKIKVILDEQNDNSFYIRDRSCIKNIVGSLEEILEMALSKKFMWELLCKERYGEAVGTKEFLQILIRSLAEITKPVTTADIDRLSAYANENKYPEFLPIFEAYKRCAGSSRLEDFRKRLTEVMYPKDMKTVDLCI